MPLSPSPMDTVDATATTTYNDNDNDNDNANANDDDNEEDHWSDAVDHIPQSLPASTPTTPSSPPPPLPTSSPPPLLQEDEPHATSSPKSNGIDQSSTSTSDDDDQPPAPKKKKPLSSLSTPLPSTPTPTLTTVAAAVVASKKPKKKSNNVWTKSTSRRAKKKSKPSATTAATSSTPNGAPIGPDEATVFIAPLARFLDKSDDSLEAAICLSRIHKAERVELSDDRLTAGSTKGYRMVRATRGVIEGAWYFEIKIVRLGESGHTRLGWTMEKGDLQAPVGFDGNSFGYRDIDGSKVHKALRDKYGEEGYGEGDVIGFYINLPDGELYSPKPPKLVMYKGQKYIRASDMKDEPPKVVPGSEIIFFKNGTCQGVAFRDLFGGRYYPAASMYTLPNQSNCEVTFNFGPDFEFFPQDFGDQPSPRPMIEVPYHGLDAILEDPAENGHAEKTS